MSLPSGSGCLRTAKGIMSERCGQADGPRLLSMHEAAQSPLDELAMAATSVRGSRPLTGRRG